MLVVFQGLGFERGENELDLFDQIEPLGGDQTGQDVEEIDDRVVDEGFQEVGVFDKATKLQCLDFLFLKIRSFDNTL